MNRATHVPEPDRLRVTLSAPLQCICPIREHNTYSDCNMRVDLEWVPEDPVTEVAAELANG